MALRNMCVANRCGAREAAKRDAKVLKEMQRCDGTQQLSLSHAYLTTIPQRLLSMEETISKIRILDLSHNSIVQLPSEISSFLNLRELWLSNNPLTSLPTSIEKLVKLETIDVRNTSLNELPPSMAKLTKLFCFDWRDTPLSSSLSAQGIETHDLKGLQELLTRVHTRKELEAQLLETLTGTHFQREADVPGIKVFIANLVNTLSEMFPDIMDFRLFVRRADTLLPPASTDINPKSLQRTKDSFYSLQRDALKQRLAADVEIKLRGFYFDRIEREAVEGTIHSIYEHVKSLEDIQFFVKYAAQVLPPNPKDASGELVWSNILTLQAELTAKRDGAINTLWQAMMGIYPEQKPEVIKQKATEVARAFQVERFATKRELNSLSQLCAEATKILPPDFPSVNPQDVFDRATTFFSRK